MLEEKEVGGYDLPKKTVKKKTTDYGQIFTLHNNVG